MKFLYFLLLLVPLIQAIPVEPCSNSKCVRSAQPTPRLAMYVQTFHDETDKNYNLSLLPLLELSIRPTHIILASLHLQATPGDIHLNNNPPSDPMFDQLWMEVKILQGYGIKVMIMMGGAAGSGTWDVLSGSDAEFKSYYDPLLTNVIEKYNLDGFDIDIEQSTDISVPLRLIQQLYSDTRSTNPDFAITMAPVASALKSNGSNLSGFSYSTLDVQAHIPNNTSAPLISFYNAQFMDGFGSASMADDYESIINAGWDPRRITMTVPASSKDASNFVEIETLKTTITNLHAKYPRFGGVQGWEYFNAGSSDEVTDNSTGQTTFLQPYTWVQELRTAISSSS